MSLDEQEIEALRTSIAQRRSALEKAKETLALMKKKLEEDKQVQKYFFLFFSYLFLLM